MSSSPSTSRSFQTSPADTAVAPGCLAAARRAPADVKPVACPSLSLPSAVHSLDLQVKRAKGQLDTKPDDLGKHAFLVSLREQVCSPLPLGAWRAAQTDAHPDSSR